MAAHDEEMQKIVDAYHEMMKNPKGYREYRYTSSVIPEPACHQYVGDVPDGYAVLMIPQEYVQRICDALGLPIEED